jgi:glycosyltransferase involved in cell wall biosynthesis
VPRVGLNGLLLESPLSGTATYTRKLVPSLARAAPDVEFSVYVRNGSLNGPRPRNIRLRTPIDRLPGPVGRRASKLLWEEAVLPAVSAARRDDLIHYLYFAAPALARSPCVVTVHDLVPLVVPGYHRSRQSAAYARFMAWTARKAAAIITVSDYSRQEIIRVLGVAEERIHVTYEAAGESFDTDQRPGELDRIRQKYGLPSRYILYLGGAERRKGLETLVRAWNDADRLMQDLETALVIVARFPPPDPLYPDIPALARSLGLRSVHFVEVVDEEDKPGLYRSALAFAFPSEYEGFGLPPLEAMACGTPVLTSDATSIPEVVGDAALLVPPGDISAWSSAMSRVAQSETLRAVLQSRGLKRAARFTWERTARETLAVYRQVLAQ